MEGGARQVSAGRVGRAHGLDGSFYVDAPSGAPAEGAEVEAAGARRRVERSAGTAQRPLLRLAGVDTREAATELRGAELLVADDGPVGEDDLLVEDLVGCRVIDMGVVERVIEAPSCDVLELDDGRLVPLVSDAIRRVDLQERVVEVDLEFLGEAQRPS